MEALHRDLRGATDVWELATPAAATLKSSDVWSTASANSADGLALAVMGRSKRVLDLFDSGRGLKGLAQDLKRLGADALDILSQEVDTLAPHEKRINTDIERILRKLDNAVAEAKVAGGVSPDLERKVRLQEHELQALTEQRSIVRSGTELYRGPVQLLQALSGFASAIEDLDRTASARQRQRQWARISHPALQFGVLFLIGVVGVNFLSDQVAGLGPVWFWLFAIASFVVIDYFLEPWLVARLDRRAMALLQRELEATKEVVVQLPLILASIAVMSATVQGMGGLAERLERLAGRFLPGARVILGLSAQKGHDVPAPAAHEQTKEESPGE
jgi:hypothetical protein